MRSPSVTTISLARIAASCCRISAMWPRSFGVMNMPRGRWKIRPNFWQASPTVGRVDDRLDLVDVVDDDAEEQRLVAVVQRIQRDVFFEIASAACADCRARARPASPSSARSGGSRPRRPSASRSASVKAVPLLSKGSRSSAMPCAGSDDVEWALTRAGLFTNSPREFLIEGQTLSASVHLRSRT